MEFDFRTLAPQDRYKLLIGTVVPRPIALVTTREENGAANAAPFSFFNVMSHDPAVLVLGIEQRHDRSPKDTVRNIRRTREFVVNMVDEAIAAAMNVCAIDFPDRTDELKEAGLTAAASMAIDTPRIAESPVNFECRLLDELRYGDAGKRSIVVGEILHVHVRDDVLEPSLRVDQSKLQLVGRLAGAGYVHLSDRFEIPRISVEEWQQRKAGVAK